MSSQQEGRSDYQNLPTLSILHFSRINHLPGYREPEK